MTESPYTPNLISASAATAQVTQYYASETARIQALNNAPAQFFAGVGADFMGRGSIQQLRTSDGLFDRMLGEMLPMAGAAIAERMGMSPASMIAATQNTFSQGGMRLQSMNGQGFMPLQGYGPVADGLTNQMFGDLNARFTHPGGAMNLNTSYGASRDDIGAVMNEMQRRGVMAGEVAGFYEPMTAARRNSLKQEYGARGDTAAMSELDGIADGDLLVRPNHQAMAKAGDWVQTAVRNIQELRTMVGNLPVQELMSEMERLTGVDIGKPGMTDSAMTSMRQRVSQGRAVGMSPREAMEFNAATTSTMDAMMSARTGTPVGTYAGIAGVMSEGIDRAAMAAWRDQQAGGGHRLLPEIATSMAAGVSNLMTETPEMAESLYAASQFDPGSESYKRIMASVQAHGNAGSVSEREESRRNMANVFEQTYGVRSGALVNSMGLDNVYEHVKSINPDLLRQGRDVLMRTDQSAMGGDYGQLINSFHESSPYTAGLGGRERTAEFAQSMMQTFGANTINDITSALRSGDPAALARATNGAQLPGFGDALNAINYAQSGIYQSSNGNLGAGDFLQHIQNRTQADPAFAAQQNAQGRAAFEQTMSNQAQVDLAGKGQQPIGSLEAAAQGLFGGEIPMEDQAMLQYGTVNEHKSIHRINLTKDGSGLAVSEAEAAALAKTMAGTDESGGTNIYAALGLTPGQDKELAAALATSKGMSVVSGALAANKDQIAGLGLNDKGEVGLVYSDDPKALKDAHDEELKTLRKGGQEKQAQRDATKDAKASQPVVIHLTLPNGSIASLNGTMDTGGLA